MFAYDYGVCNTTAEVSPDLSNITTVLSSEANATFVLPTTGPYYHSYADDDGDYDYSQQVFYESSFEVNGVYQLNARVGKNFLLGDITIKLLRQSTDGDSEYFGTYHRNAVAMNVPLVSGTYTLQLLTGYIQNSWSVNNIASV